MKKKSLFLVLAIVICAAFFGYRYIFHEHRDLGSEDATYTLTVKNLQTAFTKNDSLANVEYADKAIAIYGKVSAIDLASNTIMVDEHLSATFTEKLSGVEMGQYIRIKGRFVGYDDLLEEFKMDQVTLLNKKND